jgi:hypothetical protein
MTNTKKADSALEQLEQALALRAKNDRQNTFRHELRAQLVDAAAELEKTRVEGRVSRRAARPFGRHLAVAITATAATAVGAVIVFGGLLAASRTSTASAASILRQAAAHAIALGDVAHFTYTVTISQPSAGIDSRGRVDAWYEPGPGGAARSVQTLTLAKAPGQPEQLFGRFLQLGVDLYAYDANKNAILLPASRQDLSMLVLPNVVFDGGDLAAALHAQPGGTTIKSLPEQTVAGYRVDVVEVDALPDRPALQLLLYYDVSSHLLRGFDATSTDPGYPTATWHAALTGSETIAAAAAPAGTFALSAPAGAAVEPPRPTKQDLFAACGPSIARAAGVSVVDACQAANPGLTRAQTLERLTATANVQLQAAVSAHVISDSQAAAALAADAAQFEQATLSPAPSK